MTKVALMLDDAGLSCTVVDSQRSTVTLVIYEREGRFPLLILSRPVFNRLSKLPVLEGLAHEGPLFHIPGALVHTDDSIHLGGAESSPGSINKQELSTPDATSSRTVSIISSRCRSGSASFRKVIITARSVEAIAKAGNIWPSVIGGIAEGDA